MDIETKMAITHALLQLEREGMLVDFNYNRDGEIQFFIPTQPIPDIPNWREWCGKLQECGVKFEFDGGLIRVTNWNESKCEFTIFGAHRYHIPEQPVPEKIANYLNKEKTMSKFVKIQLPEIEVSGDVESVRISIFDKHGLYHNSNGLSLFEYKVRGNRLVLDNTANYYIHGTHYTEEDFKRATQPPKEMTVEEVEKILGHKVKIVGKTE